MDFSWEFYLIPENCRDFVAMYCNRHFASLSASVKFLRVCTRYDLLWAVRQRKPMRGRKESDRSPFHPSAQDTNVAWNAGPC